MFQFDDAVSVATAAVFHRRPTELRSEAFDNVADRRFVSWNCQFFSVVSAPKSVARHCHLHKKLESIV